MRGHHDDLIMAMAMALYVAQNSFSELRKNVNQAKAMLDSWVTVSSGGETDKIENPHVNPFYTNTPTYHPKEPTNGNNDEGEFNWLFGIK